MEFDTEAIRREKAEIFARYGKWTAHNIHLVDDVYTIQSGLTGDEFRLRRVMQIIDDEVDPTIPSPRVVRGSVHSLAATRWFYGTCRQVIDALISGDPICQSTKTFVERPAGGLAQLARIDRMDRGISNFDDGL